MGGGARAALGTPDRTAATAAGTQRAATAAWRRPQPGCARLARPGALTLDWDRVPGAAGLLVYRAAGDPFQPLDHGGGDVLARPGRGRTPTPRARRAGQVVRRGRGGRRWSAGAMSEPVAAAPPARRRRRGPMAPVRIGGAESGGPGPRGRSGELGRPWEPMIGSEHLSCVLRRDRAGGRVIGTELREALRIAHDGLGMRAVRAHGILCDDLGVVPRIGRSPVHDFGGVDRVYDRLMETGLRPVVELSFVPRALARDPGKTVFSYEADHLPPARSWGRWTDLVRATWPST